MHARAPCYQCALSYHLTSELFNEVHYCRATVGRPLNGVYSTPQPHRIRTVDAPQPHTAASQPHRSYAPASVELKCQPQRPGGRGRDASSSRSSRARATARSPTTTTSTAARARGPRSPNPRPTGSRSPRPPTETLRWCPRSS